MSIYVTDEEKNKIIRDALKGPKSYNKNLTLTNVIDILKQKLE